MIRFLRRLSIALTCALALGAMLGTPASAGEPSRPVLVAQADPDAQEDPAAASALLVRIDRLESRLRALTGQIEQLQNQNQRLGEQLRKMQQDVDFRFQDLGRGAAPSRSAPPLKRGDIEPPVDTPPAGGAEPAGTAPLPGADKPPRLRTGDAFNPAAAPDAPGAPRPLGTTVASQPLPEPGGQNPPRESGPKPGFAAPRLASAPPSAPLDLIPRGPAGAAPPVSPDAGIAIPAAGDAAPPGRAAAPNNASVASLAPGGTRAEFDGTLSLYKGGQYDAAASGLTAFVQKYPKDRLVADATYYLGESYARLGRHREAAEQFLKVSTDFARSNRAPDALLKLGIALNALGAKEQACATYQEVDRKYPTASSDVRAGVERELKRTRC